MADLGLQAYRFSIAWPRIQPGGRGPLNPAGLGFYDRLVDALLEQGIAPFATLYHWDLPQELEDEGGWADRSIVDRFVDYASQAHAALADRVQHWATLNEPWCSAWLGYGAGVHAPGIQDHAGRHPGRAPPDARARPCGRGDAQPAARDPARDRPQLPADPRRPGHADDPVVVDAVRRVDGIHNRLMLDGLLDGAYPADVLDRPGAVPRRGHPRR